MKKGETEKRQYLLRPTIYFHAEDDSEARSRSQIIQYAIEVGLKDDLTATPEFTYPDVKIEPGSLVADTHYGDAAHTVN